MNRDYSRRYRDASRFEQDRYAGGRSSRYDDPSRDEDSARWNDEQRARWLSHYGGASQRGERDYDTGTEYTQGYGDRRNYENPRYGQRFQESWEGYAPEEAWRQRGAERISPGMHGRYGWRSEEDDQGSLNFQPGEYGYGNEYGPSFGATYRHRGPRHGNEQDLGSPRRWRDEHAGGKYYGRGPSDYTRSDERIREDVCDRLTDDPHVDGSAVRVSVEAGVVTLQGEVPERYMKHRAEDCAEHISGVKDVENRLRVGRGAWNEEDESPASSAPNSTLRNH